MKHLFVKSLKYKFIMRQEAQTLVEQRYTYHCLPLFYYAKENVITP